jgi:ABC-type nitrate/sulfonate/bicarbonate transport system ATPase subunit
MSSSTAGVTTTSAATGYVAQDAPWAVRCQGVSKTFLSGSHAVNALSNVNLEIPVNSFTALVGPSGCGKTTLLHIIAGLDTDYEGKFEKTAAPGEISFLFQEPRLLPWLSAQENLSFILEARGMKRKEAVDVAHHYLQMVGLGGFERQFPSQMSGGMQQRTAMARALMVNPKIMLMDEPFASLDELTARRLRSELLRLYEEFPHTILFVTHNVTEAAYLADRVVVLGTHPGRVVADLAVPLSRPREYDGADVAEVARGIVRHLSHD